MDKYIIYLFLLCSFVCSSELSAQSGDQILDGIGETALMARYPLDRNIKDWSRNNRHGIAQGSALRFVDDDQFHHVISLSEDSYFSLPSDLLMGLESFSVGFWLCSYGDDNDQGVLDFSSQGASLFSIVANDEDGVSVTINSGSKRIRASTQQILVGEWHYITVVHNSPKKAISLYVDAGLSDEINGVEVHWRKLISDHSHPILNIGRALSLQGAGLKQKLFDLRFYSIALDEQHIRRIVDGALHQGVHCEVDKKAHADFAEDVPQLYNHFLKSVPAVEVETMVGVLPRLPRYVDALYASGIKGPKVRVLWPSPKDNSAVNEVGTYIIVGQVPGTDFQPVAKVMVREEHRLKSPSRILEPFALDQVALDVDTQHQKTKFIENRDKFIQGLAQSNPDDFLYMFRNAYGQTQPQGARALGVWDSQETKLRGHATGHYMSALAQAYASTAYDPKLQANFAQKISYMVEVLYKLSQMAGKPSDGGADFVSDPTAVMSRYGDTLYDSDLSVQHIRTDYWNWGEGYLSAYAPDQFIMLEYGAKYGTDASKVWAPYYTLHKILTGLLDVYELTGNAQALTIVQGMGDWVYARLSLLSQKTLTSMWSRYIAGEFGGMNEVMARLSRLTHDKRYLALAQLFDNTRLFFGDAKHTHGLAKNVDVLRGLHANQHIPQIMGALEIFRVSDDKVYYDIADNFWHKATNDYMYSIGGVAGASHPANAECFTGEPASLYHHGFSKGGQNETCATYNLLKLSRHLFFYKQEAALMDYYERGLYNHILASVAEHSPANTYHVPLRPGSVKHFGNSDMHGFTCCNGTALESHTKLQNSIYFKSQNNTTLYVNLYVPSTLNWDEKGIRMVQSTVFPKGDKTTLTIEGGGKFELNVRVPQWARSGFFVRINGELQNVEAKPGTYLSLHRHWNNGDVVELQMPFSFRLEPVMDQQNLASLFYGPILLAAQETAPREHWRKVVLNANDISQSITGDATRLEFYIDGLRFKPFYESYARYSVYLDVVLE